MIAEFSDLVGRTLTAIEGAETGSDQIVFITDEGSFRQLKLRILFFNLKEVGDWSLRMLF